jgi:3-dehydrosphinganine reductase
LAGLAETLRSELLLYSIGVHIFFPGTMYSPGYIEENKTKPKITLKIEESDEGMKPEQAAEVLLHGMSPSYHIPTAITVSLGVRNGNFHIVGDLVGNLFRSSTRGATPHNNVFVDGIYSFLGWVRIIMGSLIFNI